MPNKISLMTAVGLMGAIAAVEALGGKLVVVGDETVEKPEEGICSYQATKMEKAQAKRERKAATRMAASRCDKEGV